MDQENPQSEPVEEVGGYGTPTAEQEMPGAGRFGGTDDQRHAEADSNDPGFEPGEPPVPRDAQVPSAEADIDESNADSQGSAPFVGVGRGRIRPPGRQR